ncbi:MAG: threonine synthase, partial [Candidatus Marinimicrobia bacterium]|nr:threonine synthase [Candidatus Neomarinimicrobiota bacterium]
WNQSRETGPIIVSVPSGNFGNLTAGLLANRMGIPMEKIIASTNANDVFPKYLHTGNVEKRDAIATISNAMDVGIPSNLDRIQNLFHEDVNQVKIDISSWSFTDDQTKEMIRNIKMEYDYLIDPHTAVGILGLERYRRETNSKSKGVVLSTAHPGKFADVVEPIIGEKISLPNPLQMAMEKEKVSTKMSSKYSDLKEFLMIG